MNQYSDMILKPESEKLLMQMVLKTRPGLIGMDDLKGEMPSSKVREAASQHSLFLTGEVLRNLRKITRAIDLHSKRLSQLSGLTGPQAILLAELKKTGAIPVSSLAKRVSLSHATVTDILNRLSKRDMVARTRDEADKRRILISLTPTGEAVLGNSPALLQERFVSEFSKLADWEQSLILSTLQRIAEIMDADAIDAAPMLAVGNIDDQ